MAEDVLEQDLQRDGRPDKVDPIGEGGEAIEVRQARSERGTGAERIMAVRDSALVVAG
jgi:hypothetical protein